MQLYKIGFDFEKGDWNNGFVELKETDDLEGYYQHIDCRFIDFVQLTDDVIAIVDDEGLLVSGNPVFEFTLNKGKINLFGNILLGKSEFVDFEIKIKSIDDISLLKFIEQNDVKLVGITD